ncbi:MAG: hypothetical protein GX206_05945 [Clostridiales bacterium]|nr:hypothetical protein [Clostridiales bacterium]
MGKHNIYSLKGILMADVVIGLFICLFMKLMVFNSFIEVMLLGLAVAYINLAVNSFYVNRMFKNKSFLYFYWFIKLIGVVSTASIAYIFYLNDAFSALIFLGGYCVQFIGLVAIALKDLVN